MKYNISLINYVKQAIPFFYRTVRNEQWVQALLAPLQELNDSFYQTTLETKYEASFTGQVIYLEHLLNDSFDPTLRRIYIDDGSDLILPPFVFNKIEDEPLYIYNKIEGQPFYIYNQIEYSSVDDFIVFVPVALLTGSVEILIDRLVRKYKLAAKKFSIQTF